MALPREDKPQTAVMEDPKQLIQSELDDTTRALKEITLMLEQSRVELAKLAQRNTTVNVHLQQIHDQMSKLSIEYSDVTASSNSIVEQESIAALMTLGYPKAIAEKIVHLAIKSIGVDNITVENLIKTSLKLAS